MYLLYCNYHSHPNHHYHFHQREGWVESWHQKGPDDSVIFLETIRDTFFFFALFVMSDMKPGRWRLDPSPSSGLPSSSKLNLDTAHSAQSTAHPDYQYDDQPAAPPPSKQNLGWEAYDCPDQPQQHGQGRDRPPPQKNRDDCCEDEDGIRDSLENQITDINILMYSLPLQKNGRSIRCSRLCREAEKEEEPESLAGELLDLPNPRLSRKQGETHGSKLRSTL